MWRNFRRRSHTRVISQKLSRCVPRNRSLHLLGLCPTQCMQIFSRLGHQPRGRKGRKRQSSPKIRPDLFRRRRRPPRIRQPTGLMARSNKIGAGKRTRKVSFLAQPLCLMHRHRHGDRSPEELRFEQADRRLQLIRTTVNHVASNIENHCQADVGDPPLLLE